MNAHDPTQVDPVWLRGMTRRRISRRDLFKYAGTGAGALGLAAFLEACGVSGTQPAAPPSEVGTPAWWAKQKQAGELNFANWGYYIDVKKGRHPSIDRFTQQTGISVKYQEVINDNYEFLSIIRPTLQAGQDTGYDAMVLTTNSPVLDLVIHSFKWAIPLDHSLTPNFNANADSAIKNPPWDPGNKYTMAWQTGLTAIGYNPKLTGREITSVKDLFDPKFAGHVGMMDDPQELGSVGLLAIGVDPAGSTPDDWHQAADFLKKQKDAGIVRSYYGQPYINHLENGDLWISQAWSGDVVQSQKSGYTDLKMVVPDEGGMQWTDNMMIPIHAQHPLDAIKYMDYVYDPYAAALIADFITYVTPVPAARDVIMNQLHDAVAANNPLIFPTPEMKARFKQYYKFKDNAEADEWNSIFNPIAQG